jgi:FMN-dependent NADH-azoreductase
MPVLLRLDASSRQSGSHSRRLGDAYETRWKARHPDAEILRRDLGAKPLPHIADTTITGFYTAPAAMTDDLRAATALSDTLIGELMRADIVLITTPMYNFSVPSALKAWIDQVVRIGHTFSYDGQSFSGLVTGKRVVVACAYGAGGYGEGGPLQSYDLLKSYLQLLLGFLGFTDIHFVATEATTADPATVDTQTLRALAEVAHLAEVV